MKMVVSIDFSPSSQQVIDNAAKLALLTGASITLVHVAPPEPLITGSPEADMPADRDLLAQRYRNEHRELQQRADTLRNKGITITALLLQGDAVESVIRECRKCGADMLVVGSHGHGAIYDIMLGSVSVGITRRAPCPVLVIPVEGR